MVFLFIGLNKHIFKITGADLTTHGASSSKKNVWVGLHCALFKTQYSNL